MTDQVTPELIQRIKQRVAEQRETIVRFMREICAIPSMDSQIGPVGERIGAEMRKLGFDEVRFDKMGNILGRIGDGPKVIVYDSHIDTVGVGDRPTWEWDPFEGKVEDGLLYARGACDEKGSTPGMVYGLALARDLGLLEGFTAYYFGNMEEWCDGIAPNSFVEVDPKVRPDFVVIGEPTKMKVYRGHKGRLELRIIAEGKSAHAASHHLGDNAVYKMANIITAVRELDRRLRTDPFLGKATIAVTDVSARTASLNAVPDQFTIYLDRRIVFGETKITCRTRFGSRSCTTTRPVTPGSSSRWTNITRRGRSTKVTRWWRPGTGRWRRYGARGVRRAGGIFRRTARIGRARRTSPPSGLGRARRNGRTPSTSTSAWRTWCARRSFMPCSPASCQGR
ncbi:MAG: putative hydrolase [Anaerolineales bacterium]|nr:putative hydrolase [Anaerolineales bacterium]